MQAVRSAPKSPSNLGWLGFFSLPGVLVNLLGINSNLVAIKTRCGTCAGGGELLWLAAIALTVTNVFWLTSQREGWKLARFAMLLQVATWMTPIATMMSINVATSLGYFDAVRMQNADGAWEQFPRRSKFPHMVGTGEH